VTSSTNPGGRLKEVIALVSGNKVYSKLKYESGVHRVQRVPVTEQQGRVHTSAITWRAARSRRSRSQLSKPRTSASIPSALPAPAASP